MSEETKREAFLKGETNECPDCETGIHDRETEPALEVAGEDASDKIIDLAEWIDRKAPKADVRAQLVSIDERKLGALIRGRIMLAALVKQSGRVRIPVRELQSITQKSRIDVKVQENGDLVLSFLEG